MAIRCPECSAEYDVTLFTFDRKLRCDCGTWVDLAVGHQQTKIARHTPRPSTVDRSPERIRQEETKLLAAIQEAVLELYGLR